MSMIMCKYGCLSDTDYFPEFGYDVVTGEYTCEPCYENEEFVVSEEDELIF
tara:strand:+ start:823 stop:975 length:153 start_codon:yes stop_codon:yes gene_type:complete